MVSSGVARTFAVVLAALSAGCTTTSHTGAADAAAAPSPPPAADTARVETPVTGTALPAGYRIDTVHSLILGAGDSWTGRLTYSASGSADDVFEFLRREMPKFGWNETYAVRSEVNLLGFASEPTGRVANIRIERSSVLDSTHIEMIVSAATAAKPSPVRPKPQPTH